MTAFKNKVKHNNIKTDTFDPSTTIYFNDNKLEEKEESIGRQTNLEKQSEDEKSERNEQKHKTTHNENIADNGTQELQLEVQNVQETKQEILFSGMLKRKYSLPGDISNVFNKRLKLTSSEATAANLNVATTTTVMPQADQELHKHFEFALNFMDKLAEEEKYQIRYGPGKPKASIYDLITKTNKHDLNIIPETQKKVIIKQIIKVFNKLYKSSSDFRYAFEEYKLNKMS